MTNYEIALILETVQVGSRVKVNGRFFVAVEVKTGKFFNITLKLPKDVESGLPCWTRGLSYMECNGGFQFRAKTQCCDIKTLQVC